MPCLVSPPYGRLVLLQIVHPVTVENVHAMGQELRVALGQIQPTGGILASDLTRLRVVSPDVAEAFTQMMRADNKLLIGAGLLLAGLGTFALQVDRLIKDAAFAHRQAFHSRADLEAWLLPRLTPAEAEAFKLHFHPAAP